MDDSIDDERFDVGGYRDEDIAYSDDGDNFGGATAKSTVVQNQPHDEEVALSDTGSLGGRDDPPDLKDASLIESQDMDDVQPKQQTSYQMDHAAAAVSDRGHQAPPQAEARPGRLAGMPHESPEGEPDGSLGSDIPGAYNALEFKHLNVSDEVRALFQHIGRYKPQSIELETKLKPFIPDYIPSIGGIDEFIKVPRPDSKPDFLGLKVLDEPAARQSDPTVLTLQLRQLSKEAPGSKAEIIGQIQHTDEQKQKKIQGWILSINEIHKNKPAATVSYSRRMPDIEALMQEWPPEIDSFIRNMKMPSGELDLDLKTFSKLVCSLLDIPLYENPVESLHLLFSLYLEFKHNPVFGQQLLSDNGPGAVLNPGVAGSFGADEVGMRSGSAGGALSGGGGWGAAAGHRGHSAGSSAGIMPL